MNDDCYIKDGYGKCSGTRFSFCAACMTAKRLNEAEIKNAKTPVEVTAAHCLTDAQKREHLYRMAQFN